MRDDEEMTPGDALGAISEARSDTDGDGDSLVESLIELRKSVMPFGMTPGERNAFIRVARSGPCTTEEMCNNANAVDKTMGLQKFNLTPSSPQAKRGGNPTCVYYIEELHDKEEVVRRWVEANETNVRVMSDSGLYRATPREFRSTIASVLELNPATNPGGHKGPQGGVCPMCGEEYEGHLPTHLTNECSGVGDG